MRSAVFPLAVAPVTRVNFPRGKMISISFSSNHLSSTGLSELSLPLSAGVATVIFGFGFARSTEFHMKRAPPVMPRVGDSIEIESEGVVGGGCLREETNESTSSSFKKAHGRARWTRA